MDARLVGLLIGLFALGALLIAIAGTLPRQRGISMRKEWVKYAAFACIVLGMLGAARLGRPVLAAILFLACARGGFEIGRVVYGSSPGGNPGRTRVALLSGVLLCLCLGTLLPGGPGTWEGSFTFVFVVVATADAYAQLTGKLLGRHSLCPRLSPAKTIEGLVGGTIAAVGVAFFLRFLAPAPLPKVLLLALLTVAGATAGDLAFSFVKRRAGVKDYPPLIPGHGGVLDRFDSLIVAAPVYFWARALLLG